MIRKKILLIGDFGVGKTSLIRRYIDKSFSDKYISTIGVKISKKILQTGDTKCELLIWDIEGETAIKRIPHSYYKGSSGAIFVADISRSETLKSINEHISTFLMLNTNAKYVIAYSKSDLLSAQQKAELELPSNTFLTSAKDGMNVSKLFHALAKEILP